MDPICINLRCMTMADSPGEVNPNFLDEISRARLSVRRQLNGRPRCLKQTLVRPPSAADPETRSRTDRTIEFHKIACRRAGTRSSVNDN